eukprot:6203289-Pleurochrysis_carterae.AAC.1
MLRDVIYASITFEMRKRLHNAAADLVLAEASIAHTRDNVLLLAFMHYKAAEQWEQLLQLAADAAQQERPTTQTPLPPPTPSPKCLVWRKVKKLSEFGGG